VGSAADSVTVDVQRRRRQSTVVIRDPGTRDDGTDNLMPTTTSVTTAAPATDVRDARLIWVTSTTVGAERGRLSRQLSKARSVFGVYGETTQPAVARLVEDLRDLNGQAESATLIPVPHTFGATRASQLLPRGARVVGWLDAEGYRRVQDTPQPSREWLESEAALVR
jgi:hypothetical protein